MEKLTETSKASVESVKKARNARDVFKGELAAMTKDRDNMDAQLKICKEELLMRNGIIKSLEDKVNALKDK